MNNELINRAKDGDKKAFELIFSEDYRRELYIIAKSKLKNPEDVKDVVQETILLSYRNICDLKDVRKFEQWVNKILINNCNNIYRDRNRSNVSFDEFMEDICVDITDDFILIDEDLDLFNFIDFLEDEEKYIMFLHMNEYNSREIGKILRMNSCTVRTKIRRIREKLKLKYRKRDE